MTDVALIPNRARTGWIRVEHRPEDEPVLREVFLDDVYHLNGIADTAVRGRVCIDVGANIGAVTNQLLDLGASGVFAIEPEQENLKLLLANTSPHSVTYDDRAIGNPALFPTARMMGTSGTAFAGIGPGPDVIAFDTVIRDALLGQQDETTVGVLKVDVEGAEYPWFDTASIEAQRRVDHIVMEWHGPHIAPHLDPDPERYGRLLRQLARTHAVSVFGRPDDGGMLYAHRYDL